MLSLLLLSGELHTSTASHLPEVLLPLLDCGCCFFCSISPLGTVRVTYSFLLSVSAGLLAPLGNSDPCVLFLFSPSFISSERNYTEALPLSPVVRLLYSNLFLISEGSQTWINCFWSWLVPLTAQSVLHLFPL